MKRSSCLLRVLVVAFCLGIPLSAVRAAITYTGDVEPDPNTWTSSTIGQVGNTADGTLTVNLGTSLVSNYGWIAEMPGVTGVMTVDGAGTTWTGLSQAVGINGNGTLNITGGATVFATMGYGGIGEWDGSTGAVTVDGTGSTWADLTLLYVGLGGNGTLNVTNGGAVSNSNVAYIGYSSGSTSSATVSGTQSTWTNGPIDVGISGNGTLSVSGGGTVSSSSGSIAGSSGSTSLATVDGVGSTWTNSGSLVVGGSGGGTLSVTNGGAASSSGGSIGASSGSTGLATVDGAGSTWTNSGTLVVGNSGGGTLSVTNGGAVSVAGTTYVGFGAGSAGTIAFGANGGALTTGSLAASPSQLKGTGTIDARGLVSDVNLVFDSAASLKQTLTFNNQPGQNITVNLDLASAPSTNGALGAGWQGNGSLTIEGGIAVNSQVGYLGYGSNSTAVATVDGAGSKWINSSTLSVGNSGSGTLTVAGGGYLSTGGDGAIGGNSGSTGAVTITGAGSTWSNGGHLYVGSSGNGTLNISGGGTVSDSNYGAYIGYGSGSTGVATVDGAGSTWTNNGSLYVGYSGAGTLTIAAGGAVAATGVSISNSQSLLAIDVGDGSRLTVAGGTITNNGAVRILAGARPAAGATFTPLSAATWSGSGKYQTIGGTWNASSHVFTVSGAVDGTAGTPVAIDPSKEQRVLITNAGAGTSVGASFVATTSTSTIGLTALPTSSTALSSLASQLSGGESALSGWTFLSANYTAGNPVYLSLSVAGGYSHDDFDVWDYNGNAWTALPVSDLAFDGSYANFTAYALNGWSYAVSGVALLPGDANGDGKVDINDLTIVLANFGKTGTTWSQGEFTGDGKVDINDLTVVLANYGQTAGASAGGMAAVPEPSTFVLIGVGAISLFGFVRRWQKHLRHS